MGFCFFLVFFRRFEKKGFGHFFWLLWLSQKTPKKRENSGCPAVRFLARNASALGPLADKTCSELGWVGRDVISVAPDLPAIDAMLLMEDAGISAVAVVAESGKLVGNFSVSEMRCAAPLLRRRVAEMNRMRLVLFDTNNRMFGPCLATSACATAGR
jgi:CBS domain